MKKIFSLTLTAILTLSVAACGNNEPATTTAAETTVLVSEETTAATLPAETEAPSVETSSGSEDPGLNALLPTVEKAGDFVIMIWSAELAATYTDEQFEEMKDSYDDAEVTKQEDGSIKVVMSKEEYEEKLEETRESVTESLKSLTEEPANGVKSVEVNQDLTQVTLLVDEAVWSGNEFNFVPMVVYMSTMSYHTAAGLEPELELIIKDVNTNEIIDTQRYPQ